MWHNYGVWFFSIEGVVDNCLVYGGTKISFEQNGEVWVIIVSLKPFLYLRYFVYVGKWAASLADECTNSRICLAIENKAIV